MPFVPKIQVTAQDGSKSVTITDVTGSVAGGTPTGWGDPNPTGAVHTILQYANYLEGITGEYRGPYLDPPILDKDGSVTVLASNFGLTGDIFPDGVGNLKAIYFHSASPVVWIAGSRRVSVTNPQNFITGAKYVSFQQENEINQKYSIYTIDESIPIEADGFYVIEPLPTIVVASQMQTGYEADTFALFTQNGEDCLAKAIGEYAVTSQKVPCDLTDKLNYWFMLLKSAQVYAAAGNNQAAHELILQLNELCSPSTTNCGCK